MSSTYTGDPTLANAPATAPYLEGVMKISLPADGDADSAATFSQAYESLTNEVQWLQQIYQFRVHDDFIDATSTLANRYTITDANAGAHAVVDDSANGGFGALQQDGSAGATAISTAQSIMGSSPGTSGNFRLRMSVRITNTNGSTTAEYGFKHDNANRVVFFLFPGSLHWGVKVDAGTVVVSSSVIASATYQTLEVLRLNGTLYVFANGTQIYTAADAVNRNGCGLYASTTSAIGYVDYFDLR